MFFYFNFNLNVKHISSMYIAFLIVHVAVSEQNEIKNDSKTAEALYVLNYHIHTLHKLVRRLYKLERTEQGAAIQALLKLGTEIKQSKMVEAISDRVFSVIKKSKFILEKANYIPGESNFPTDDKIRDALSNILENTAFLGDIILRLPDLSQKVIMNNSEWDELFKWSLVFTNKSLLIDKKTAYLLNLVNQEMNYTDRKPNFVNPYRKLKLEPLEEVTEKNKKIKKKKKISKGPRLSLTHFGEL